MSQAHLHLRKLGPAYLWLSKRRDAIVAQLPRSKAVFASETAGHNPRKNALVRSADGEMAAAYGKRIRGARAAKPWNDGIAAAPAPVHTIRDDG